MICPGCKMNYEGDITVCPDCKIELQIKLEDNIKNCHDCMRDIASENNEVVIKGKKLKCAICGSTEFFSRSSLLNSRGMTFMGLDWLNQGATNYICCNCGYIFWFADSIEQYVSSLTGKEDKQEIFIDYETSEAKENECPNCFHEINKIDEECPNCGYKLK